MLLSRKHCLFVLITLSFIIKLACIGTNDLLVEEAYYWNYAMHPDFSYLDHPPMVAFLIRCSTYLFGTNEFGVRFPAIVCWLLTAYFSFKLTETIKPYAGIYAVFLLSLLPFFFIHSLIITPDIPLITCWAAALFYLYNALILKQKTAWFYAGIWLGFGMLSKYTIVLLAPATLLYLTLVPDARQWFKQKQPYMCLLITIALFSPVIYWNATHDFVSFAFQSTRRLNEVASFSLHELFGLFVVFLTPVGIVGFYHLVTKAAGQPEGVNKPSIIFLRIFTLTPLLVFAVFSINHEIKFNWIGPSLLATIPWLAIIIQTNHTKIYSAWLITAVSLLCLYTAIISCITFGKPQALNKQLFSKYISWRDLTHQVLSIAAKTQQPLTIVPLDVYNIASELSFYQATFQAQHTNIPAYTIIGRDFFGLNSLMYQYWSKKNLKSGSTLLLIAENPALFSIHEVLSRVTAISPLKTIWAHSQGDNSKIRPYYYQIVQVRQTTRE